LYLDEECGYATFVDTCRAWRRSRPHAPAGSMCLRSLDKKSGGSVKCVLQRGPLACVLFPLSTSIVNVIEREHHHRPFKLFDYGSPSDMAPVDFDGQHLLVIDRSQSGTGPTVHLVHLDRGSQTHLDDLPQAQFLTALRLWGPDCVACVAGREVHIYDHGRRMLRRSLIGHGAEIVAVDARNAETIATLGADGVIKLWRGSTGECTRTLRVPGANFFLAYPYCLCLQDQRIAMSSDEGVWMLDVSPRGGDA